MKNTEYGQELDQLLKKAVERQEALKMPKKKPHWKHRAKKALERSRRREKIPGVRRYRAMYKKSIKGQWVQFKHDHKDCLQMDYEDWVWMWTMARPSKLGPAWQYRGRYKTDVQVWRVEKDKPFSLDNLEIWQDDRRLWP